MAADIPTTEPTVIIAGDTLAWTKTLADYLADEYTLKYRLINATAHYDITATADGTDHAVSVSAATTATYTAGEYTLQSYVEKGSGASLERYTLDSKALTVKPNIAGAAAGLDLRTPAKQALDAMNEALIAYGKKAYTQQYTLKDRSVTFRSNEEFMNMRARLLREVAAEEGKVMGYTQKVKFI